jgi:hypothetical protein
MRKFFIFFFLAVLSASQIHAQQKTTVKKKPDWGVKTGINLASLHMDESEGADENSRIGFVFGAFFRIHAGAKFMVQPEFLYSSMGGKTTQSISGDAAYRLNYFSIPILARYQLSKNWYAVAGPQFDIMIQAKQIANETPTKNTNDYNESSINGTAGVEFWPSHCVGLCGRYIYGFTDISTDKNSSSGSLKNRAIQLTVALKL